MVRIQSEKSNFFFVLMVDFQNGFASNDMFMFIIMSMEMAIRIINLNWCVYGMDNGIDKRITMKCVGFGSASLTRKWWINWPTSSITITVLTQVLTVHVFVKIGINFFFPWQFIGRQ